VSGLCLRAAGMGTQFAPAATLGRFRAATQLHRQTASGLAHEGGNDNSPALVRLSEAQSAQQSLGRSMNGWLIGARRSLRANSDRGARSASERSLQLHR
jgi:hypothetical protein